MSLPLPLKAAVDAAPLLSPLLDSAGVKLGGGDGGGSDVTVEGPLAASMRRAAYPADERAAAERGLGMAAAGAGGGLLRIGGGWGCTLKSKGCWEGDERNYRESRSG